MNWKCVHNLQKYCENYATVLKNGVSASIYVCLWNMPFQLRVHMQIQSLCWGIFWQLFPHHSRVLWEKQKMARISLRVRLPGLCAVMKWLQHRAPHLGSYPVPISVVTAQLHFLKVRVLLVYLKDFFFFFLTGSLPCSAFPHTLQYSRQGKLLFPALSENITVFKNGL